MRSPVPRSARWGCTTARTLNRCDCSYSGCLHSIYRRPRADLVWRAQVGRRRRRRRGYSEIPAALPRSLACEDMSCRVVSRHVVRAFAVRAYAYAYASPSDIRRISRVLGGAALDSELCPRCSADAEYVHSPPSAVDVLTSTRDVTSVGEMRVALCIREVVPADHRSDVP